MRIFKLFLFIISTIFVVFFVLILNNTFFGENNKGVSQNNQASIYYEDEYEYDDEYEDEYGNEDHDKYSEKNNIKNEKNGGVVNEISTFIKQGVENKTEEILDGFKSSAESTVENIISDYFTLDGISNQINKLTDTLISVYDLLNRPKNMKEGNYLVVRVSDGDTITVNKIINGKVNNDNIRVRLLHIDAPESDQSYGEQSAEFLKKLVYNKEVSIDYEKTDRYGRILGIVYVDGVNVNEEMVRTGNAWWYRRYSPNEKTYEKLEKEAKKQKLGLFSDKNPKEPWKHREQRRGRKNN